LSSNGYVSPSLRYGQGIYRVGGGNLAKWFFDDIATHANFIEEGFESFLANPVRLTQEAALARKNLNYISNMYGQNIPSRTGPAVSFQAACRYQNDKGQQQAVFDHQRNGEFQESQRIQRHPGML
jgi:hypothetical protein